jgi:hypothetical protein
MTSGQRPTTARAAASTSLFDRIAPHQLLVVTGKGGVGKSIVSAALARLLAYTGRRVLLVEIDPRETQHELAGVQPSGGDFVKVRPGLLLQNLQPRRVFEAAVRENLRPDFLVRRVVGSPVFSHFVDAAPGLKELAILGHALRVIRGIEPTPFDKTDVVVLDAPATGHGVSMLAAPRVVAEVVDAGPFADMAKELAEFVDTRAATGVVVVTLAEDMAVDEALELRQALMTRVRREPDLLVVNAVYPSTGSGSDPPGGERVNRRGATGRAETSGPLDLWRRRRAINDRELARLSEEWVGPRVVLPLIPKDRGPALLDEFVQYLRAALEEPVE